MVEEEVTTVSVLLKNKSYWSMLVKNLGPVYGVLPMILIENVTAVRRNFTISLIA
jgi:hypothetical protein